MEYVIVSNENIKIIEKRVVYYLQTGYKLRGELSVVYNITQTNRKYYIHKY